MRNAAYNSRKRATLEALERAFPYGLRADALAWQTRFFPKRSIYCHLNRLWRFGLLQRRRDAQGFLVYRITARGRSRLGWLGRQTD